MAQEKGISIPVELDDNKLKSSIDAVKQKLSDFAKTAKTKVNDFKDGFVEGIREGSEEVAGNDKKGLLSRIFGNFSKAGKQVKQTFTDVNASLKQSNGLLMTFVKSGIIARAIISLFRAFKNAMKEGFQNLAKEDERTNASLSMLMSSLEQLKNALATAFAPILNIVAPILNNFIQMLTTVANKIAYLMAVITGQGTYKVANAVQKDYAKSLDKTAGKTKKATKEAKKYKSSLDEIATWQKDNKDDSSSGAGSASTDPLFSEKTAQVPKWLNKIKDYLGKIKNIFKSGFLDGLGDWKSRLQNIKDNIELIKDALRDIFTDPRVVKSADEMVKKIVYALGQIVGATASIGLTIAQNIIGGIAKFLDGNREYLKQKLINIFDVTGEIAELIGNFSASFARVFEVFGGENGQRVTASLIGIFTSAFLEITELTEKCARDLIQLLTKPFTDNETKIKKALDDTLGAIAGILETIEKGVQDVGSELNKCYDDHIKPFVDDVTDDLSTLVGKITTWWDEDIVPILNEFGEGFKTKYDTKLHPTISALIDLLGELLDAFRELVEYVKPYYDELLNNKLDKLKDKFGNVCDFILFDIGLVSDTIKLFADTASGALKTLILLLNGDFKGALESWTETWRTQTSEIKSIIADLVDYIGNKFRNKIADLQDNPLFGSVAKLFGNTTTKSLSRAGMPSNIPQFASGAVIPPNSPFMAVLGDQKSGTNFEAPESLLRQVIREEGGSGSYQFTAQINRRTLFDEVINEAKLRQSASGKNPFSFA